MKRLLLLVLFFSPSIMSLESMSCSGEVGNAYFQYKSEYKTYGKKTVTFDYDCGWVKRKLLGGKGCEAYLNNVLTGGYEMRGVWYMSKPTTGEYNSKTNFLTYKLTEGYMQKGNIESLNQTQRWFNGTCR
jgi:hypothetical protein